MFKTIAMHDIDVQNGPSLVVTQIAVYQRGLGNTLSVTWAHLSMGLIFTIGMFSNKQAANL